MLLHKANEQVIERSSKLKIEMEEYMIEGCEQVEYNVIDCELEKLIDTPHVEEKSWLDAQEGHELAEGMTGSPKPRVEN